MRKKPSFRKATHTELEQLAYTVAFSMRNAVPCEEELEGARSLIEESSTIVFPDYPVSHINSTGRLLVSVYENICVDLYIFSEHTNEAVLIAHGVGELPD